jgi:urease accessory protein
MLTLLLLTDSRFPAGGYAHSGGLEAAVEAGLGVDGVPGFLRGRLHGVAWPEACLAVAARRAGSLEELLELDAEALARCPSPSLRLASSRLGSQLLRTAATVWPGELDGYRGASAATPRPVAFGAVAAVAGLDEHQTAYAYLYEDAAAVTTAAVRLLPVDGAQTAHWLVETASELELLAERAKAAHRYTCTGPWVHMGHAALPGGFAPALELGSLAHAAREGRLFAS